LTFYLGGGPATKKVPEDSVDEKLTSVKIATRSLFWRIKCTKSVIPVKGKSENGRGTKSIMLLILYFFLEFGDGFFLFFLNDRKFRVHNSMINY
jgi:hypothetical protein